MSSPILGSKRTLTIYVVLVALILTACNAAPSNQPKIFTVGIVAYDASLDSVVGGFKAAMTDLGYVDGKTINYVYHGVLKNDPQVIDTEVKSLLAQKVDLLYTLGNLSTQVAQKDVQGTNVPVVFAAAQDPIGAGFVTSISHPGGNITGVAAGDYVPKALEWLIKASTGIEEVYVPYNPADAVSVMVTNALPDVANKLGVEIRDGGWGSPDDVLISLRVFTKRWAVFLVPSPNLAPNMNAIIQGAITQGLALGSASQSSDLAAGALVYYGPDLPSVGKQTARIVDKILNGAKPTDLPVETADSTLGINLKTAQAIGMTVPDDVLRQAQTIVR